MPAKTYIIKYTYVILYSSCAPEFSKYPKLDLIFAHKFKLKYLLSKFYCKLQRKNKFLFKN